MYLAFKKAAFGNEIDLLIAAHDAGPYSHVELVLDRIYRKPPDYPKCAWSARYGSGWWNQWLLFPSEKWDRIPIDCTEEQEVVVMDWCIAVQGVQYDTPGVFAFTGLAPHEDSSKFFCSEGCLAALQQKLNLFPEIRGSTISPNALARLFGSSV